MQADPTPGGQPRQAARIHFTPSPPPHVTILLATFNGERFLRPQLDSLLAQGYADCSILARDDGSRDGTRGILEEYAALHPTRVTLLPAGPATGSARENFRHLLLEAACEQAPGTATLFAFCDQDDVWLPDKLAVEVKALLNLADRHGYDQPLLVFTDLTTVDDTLAPVQPSFWRGQGINPRNIFRLRRLLAQNVVTGSTMLINLPLARLAARMPPDAFMHDWWIALLAAAFGHAQPLRRQTVLYRQHAGNVLGAVTAPAGRNLLPKWRDHGERRAQWEMAAHQALAFERVHAAAMPPGKRRVLQRFLRVERHGNRLVRAASFLGGRFFFNTPRNTAAILWYLWDMRAAKSRDPQDIR